MLLCSVAVFGTFTDIPARAFFAVQCDTEYRKKWDHLVVQLDIVDQDTKNEVIYWHMHFPVSQRTVVVTNRAYRKVKTLAALTTEADV